MGEEQTQAVEAQQEQEAAAQAAQAQVAGAEGQEPEAEKQFDAAYVQKLRSEAAKYRKRLRELEEALKAKEEAEMSEQERLQKRLAELEKERDTLAARAREQAVRFEVAATAQRLGIQSADAAWRLLDTERLAFDDEGKPTNLEALLRETVQKYPFLVGTAQASATNPARGQSSRLTLEDIKRMSPEEINRRWDEVRAVLEGNS